MIYPCKEPSESIVFKLESIDGFIAEGIDDAAESIGVDVSSEFKRACIGEGDKTNILKE